MKRVRVRYVAILREQRGLAEEDLATEAGDAGELYALLSGRHGFSLPSQRLRVAVNDEFAAWTAPIKDGDVLVFLPPVSGG